MRLQVALDFDDMQQCLNVADCVNAYVDILECGTDLLVRYGMDAVKTLRERYPQKTILCDQKIMDGGHYFGCMANDFGADIFTVLGVSADETVKGAIAAARERNIQVLVDMCSVPDYKARAVQIRSWGADYICIHTPTDQQAEYSFHEHVGETEKRLCIFEHIYFSRPDSRIDGVSVHRARVTAGACLAMEHPVQADVVIGVPDSGIDAAIGYARQSGIPYGMGFIKNKYIGRTFIAPGQKAREDKVKIKLNVISETIRGKRVVMVDDSIVRGTTSARIVKLLREAGAKEVHVRSSAPPFLFPCYYGTDVDSQENLIAVNHTMDEIRDIIGADSIGYLNLDHLGMLMGTPKGCGYCAACFDGNYPTEVPTETCKNRFEGKLSERSNNHEKSK